MLLWRITNGRRMNGWKLIKNYYVNFCLVPGEVLNSKNSLWLSCCSKIYWNTKFTGSLYIKLDETLSKLYSTWNFIELVDDEILLLIVSKQCVYMKLFEDLIMTWLLPFHSLHNFFISLLRKGFFQSNLVCCIIATIFNRKASAQHSLMFWRK